MRNSIDKALLEDFFRKRCSPEEAKVVLQWLRDPKNFDLVRDIMNDHWNIIDSFDTSEDIDYQHNWRLIKEEIKKQQSNRKKSKLVIMMSNIAKAAAVVLLVLAVRWFISNQRSADIDKTQVNMTVQLDTLFKESQKGQRLSIKLPDGTVVTLNSASKLKYLKNFSKDSRNVYLEGEAFFEVAHNANLPFNVYSGPIVTTALGTAFNVQNQYSNSNVEVVLTSGKVAVSTQTSEQLPSDKAILQPGEKLVYNEEKKSITTTKFDVEKATAWKDGILIIENADVYEVKRQLENWYAVEIVFSDVPNANWKFSGKFRNETLKNVLDGLSYSKGLQYKIVEDKVTINFN